MDSLIRLDILMPIAPLTENNITIHSAADDVLNQNSQKPVVDGTATNLNNVPDLIDLTTPQGDKRLPPNLGRDMATKPIPLAYPPVVILDEENVSDDNHRSLTKHKLPPFNHSPSKVPRTDYNGSSLAIVDSNGNSQSSSRSTFNHENSGPIIPPSSVMKNHTVTSVNDDLQFDINIAGTSDEFNLFRPYSNIQNAHANIPGCLLADKEPKNYGKDVFPPNFHQGIMEDKHIQTKFVQQKTVKINNEFGLRENKVKESAMFYQLLDMFPDIDLQFLESKCRLGLDINQVSEIILEMNDYPKDNFQTFDRSILTPKVVVNVNLNNFNIPTSCSSSTTHILADEEVKLVSEGNRNDNLSLNAVPTTTSLVVSNMTSLNRDPNIPTSCSSSTTHILADKKVKLVSEGNRNDNLFLNAVPTTTSLVVSTMTSLNHDPTTQIPGNGKDDNESSPLCNSQKTSDEVMADKYKQIKLVGKEKTDLLDKNDDFNSSQSQFRFLMEIFPDADPTFMEIKSKLKDTDLRNFIADSMEKHDYPKVTASVKCENEVGDESVEIGLYTTNFNLENFIKIFPDPFGYFLGEKRNCQYTEHGIGFLKRRYRCHAIKLISLKYKEFKYNLVKTCEFLDAEKPSRVTKRGLNEIKMPEGTNLPFLQEACFIEHKNEIKHYLDGVAEAKRLSYEQAEANGELIECGCCYQNVLFEDCASCNEGHLFCKTCVRKSVEVRIGDGHTTFPCLQDCDSVFALQLLEALVDATLFSRLLQRIQMDEVRAADIEGLEVCPFCDFAIILPPETSIFKCLNPECLKESCRKCHKLSHIPQRCEELESDDQARARKYIEDEMTRALVRVCYKCKKSFIKIDGCNKMTCSCGAKMCYICREPIIDYKHFNGPGGEEKQKCPLYSTEKLLHVDAVEAVAKKALEEVTSKNPELKLKHDPSKLLPHADSAKTTLPPGVNEEAERLINVLQNLQQHNERIQQANNNWFPPERFNPQLWMGRPHHQDIRPAAPVIVQAGENHHPQVQQNQRAAAGLINLARVDHRVRYNHPNMVMLARHIEDHRGGPPHYNNQTH